MNVIKEYRVRWRRTGYGSDSIKDEPTLGLAKYRILKIKSIKKPHLEFAFIEEREFLPWEVVVWDKE